MKRTILTAMIVCVMLSAQALAGEGKARLSEPTKNHVENRFKGRLAKLEDKIERLKRQLRREVRKRKAADARLREQNAKLQDQIDAIREQCCQEAVDPCDLSGIDFGPCDAILGWGGIDGDCQEISGCESPVPLFESEEACLKECLCRDLSGIDFGPCEALIGYGVIDGACVPISGCPPSPVPLFSSMAECNASCTQQPRCGGIGGFTCPDHLVCIDDPTDQCDPACNGADCIGICVRQDPDQLLCGGIAGIRCPDGFTCVDAPGDDCSPNCGGADCSGICVEEIKGR